jgi:DEAD/DEAH box helicase domain-containing protein
VTKIIIYDCEIIHCIPPRNGYLDPRFSYCQGWHDFKNMGISVIAFQLIGWKSFSDGLYSITNLDNSIPYSFDSLKEILSEAPLVIGFNSKKFDDALLKANNIVIQTHYDLLEEIRHVGYGSSRWQDQPKGRNYSLDAIARANGMKKAECGNLVPQLWQQGQYQKVIDYCLNDVRLTTSILQLGQQGNLIDPNTGKYLKLKKLENISIKFPNL